MDTMNSEPRASSNPRVSDAWLIQNPDILWKLLEELHRGIAVLDALQGIVYANSFVEGILGVPLEELLGKTALDPIWRAVHEDGSAFQPSGLPGQAALDSGTEVRNVVAGIFNRREDDFHWVRIDAFPIYRTSEQKPYRSLTIFEDISSSKKGHGEAESRVASNRAAAAETGTGPDLKQEIKAVAYEIRSSLDIILGWASIWWDQGRRDPRLADRAVNLIKRHVDSIAQSLDRLAGDS